jgi:hypothetical protein
LTILEGVQDVEVVDVTEMVRALSFDASNAVTLIEGMLKIGFACNVNM